MRIYLCVLIALKAYLVFFNKSMPFKMPPFVRSFVCFLRICLLDFHTFFLDKNNTILKFQKTFVLDKQVKFD